MISPTYKVLIWRPNRKRRHTLYRGLTLEKAQEAALTHSYLARSNKILARFDVEQERIG